MMSTPPTVPSSSDFPLASSRSRKAAWAFLAVVLVAHAIQAVRLFPSPASIVDPVSPPVMVDHAIHLYHGSLGASFFRDHGTTWGFDPSFMAGYPETPIWDSSSNPSILFQLLAGGGYQPRAYKIGLLLFSLLIPVVIAGGAWALGLGVAEVAVGTALAWLYFWSGFAAPLWRSGLFAFVSASAGVGLLLGLCARFDRRQTWPSWAAMTVCGALLFFIHVTTPVMAIGGLIALYARVARTRPWRWHAAVVGAMLVVVAVNLVWLVPLARFRDLRVGSGMFMAFNGPTFLVEYYLGVDPILRADGRLGLLTLVPGVLGLLRWRRLGRHAEAAAFGGSIVFLMLLTNFGSEWGPTRVMEPLRFRVPLQFLLAVPAGFYLVEGAVRLARKLGGGTRGPIAVTLAVGLAMFAWAWAEPRVVGQIAFYLTWNRPLVVGIAPESQALVDWVRTNTDTSARIMLEDQLRLLENTDAESVHWTPLLPDLLGKDARMWIGGLYQTAFIRHHQTASFGDFQLGSRPIHTWDTPSVKAYCDTYNVGWVICWSPLSRFWFDRFEGATRVATLPRLATPGRPPSPNEHEWRAMVARAGPVVAQRYMLEGEGAYAVYRVNRPRSFFVRGKGRLVSFGPNRVELADVEPQDGAAVLSLHWLDTWKTDPPVTIGPEPVPPDSVPFIRIESRTPIPRLVIENRY